MTSQILSHLRQPLIAAALIALTGLPAAARTREDSAQTRVIHLPASPAHSNATARRSIARLERAALDVCGGGHGSLSQVKAAVRQSSCWHRAMADAVGQSTDARLRAWWAAHPS